jgi:hypothetical protein
MVKNFSKTMQNPQQSNPTNHRTTVGKIERSEQPISDITGDSVALAWLRHLHTLTHGDTHAVT